jgi:signal transduction histidine kinase
MFRSKFKILTIPWWTYLLIGIIGIMVIKILFISYQYSMRVNSVYAPLIYASVEVELNATTAHLLVEEILNGDHFKEEDVWKKYALAEWYVGAILNGGEMGQDKILPLKDKNLRLIVQDLEKRLSQFKNISGERLKKREVSGAGTEIDQRYNRIFRIFLDEAESVKNQLQLVMLEDLKDFRTIFISLLIVALALGVVVIFNFYRLERLRAKDISSLQEANDELESEIEDRRRAESELRDSREQLRKLTNQLQVIRENEKTRISREIHDELGQILTGLKMELSCLEVELDSPGVVEKLQSMGGMIDSTINSVRRIATELRPQILDTCGLLDALEWQGMDYQARTGIDCKLELPNDSVKLDSQLSTAIFRICQETLTNVARHAGATEVRVSLKLSENELCLTVKDNGKGIEPDKIYNSNSLGLLGIQERANYWGGHVTIDSPPGEGALFTINMPLNGNHTLENV